MNCEIIQADFSETLSRVASLGGADLILMSPPYPGVARTYGQSQDAAIWTLADYQRLGDCVKPALKPGGHCLMVLDAPVREWRKGYGTERGFLPWQVMLDWAERVGLRVPDRMAYGRMGQPGLFPGRFRNDWEPLLWFQGPGGPGHHDPFSIAEKAAWGVRIGRIKSATVTDGEHVKRVNGTGRAVQEGLRLPGTLWWYGIVGGIAHGNADDTEHPARFSLRFAEDAVRCFCPVGGFVADPFTGSGTSAVAAVKHGRRFFGGDLLARPSDGKPWAEVALERVREATRQQELFGATP